MTRKLTFAALTADRWHDLERLFGPERGASGGCWCMWWRVRKAEYDRLGRDGRKRAMRQLVEDGEVPGIIGYDAGHPVAWCAIARRESTPRFNGARVAAPASEVTAADWAITCFYIAPTHRHKRLMSTLVTAALKHARKHGARTVEGCPIEPKRRLRWGEGFVGIASVFRGAAFVDVAKRSPTRSLMRRHLRRKRAD